MKYYSQPEAMARMNRLAEGKRPFLFVVDYSKSRSIVEPLDEVDASQLLYSFPQYNNVGEDMKGREGKVEWKASPEPLAEYRRKFETVQQGLHAGNSFLTNLTCKVPIETNLSLRDIFLRSEALYKLWIKGKLVCFSPEIFIRIADNRISGFPMKGTIDAGVAHAEEVLMGDAKEAAEHATIVDLIRNDLSMVAEGVHVPRYRYVDRLKTNRGEILQTSSEIAGRLPEGWRSRLGEMLFAQLPAGSITGAPKPSTMDLIARAEDYDRGFYTGVMGVFDNGRMESGVMIRYIEEEAGRYYFKAGGGITAQSQCESEYNEVIQKTYVPIH